MSDLDFRGKTALVTGGTRGIGAAVARELAARGARVVLNYRENDAAAEATLASLLAAGGQAELRKANLVHPEAIRDLVAGAAGAGLDLVVHAAALGSFKPVLDVKPNQWDLTMAVNARAFLLLAREAAAALERSRGSLIALSSLGGARVVPEYGAIGASKAALESVVRSLAVELAPLGIRVNAVSGGFVDTDAIRLHPSYPAIRDRSAASVPGRVGRPEDVARAVLLLASPLAAWITGQVIVADGGASLPIS